KAALEHGVRGPLQEVELYKEEIRELSRQFNLDTWDKPSYACLSSRIAYGEEITISKLTSIDQAEAWLRQLGIRQVRVRHHDQMARIEVEEEDFPRLVEIRKEVVQKLTALGYQYVTLDLSGYQSGSMNKMLDAQ